MFCQPGALNTLTSLTLTLWVCMYLCIIVYLNEEKQKCTPKHRRNPSHFFFLPLAFRRPIFSVHSCCMRSALCVSMFLPDTGWQFCPHILVKRGNKTEEAEIQRSVVTRVSESN